MKRLLTFFLAALAIIGLRFPLVGSLLPVAHAESAPVRLTISPVTFDLTANPGDVISNQIKVTNASDETLQLDTKIENIAGTGENGQVQLTEDETKFSLSSWVTTTPSKFSLSPHEIKILTYTIHVPANAEPGGHYGSILVGTTASDKLNSSGASISQRIGSLLLIKVSGTAQESAVISRMHVIPYTGQWDEVTASDGKTKILVAHDIEHLTNASQKYFDKGPIAFDIQVHNIGNVHVKPIGSVVVYNLFHRKVADLPLDGRNVFPGADRRLIAIWPAKRLWGGFYRAQLVSVYGNGQSLISETSFWAFPRMAAIVLGIVVLLLLVARKRLIRVIRVLIRGE